MDSFYELTELFTGYEVRTINVLTNHEEGNNAAGKCRYRELYNGLREQRWQTADEMAAHFGYQSETEKGFRRLKDGLIDRLVNSALFIDLTGNRFTEYQRLTQELFRLWAAAEALRKRGGKNTYFSLANECLRLALDTKNNQAIIEISRQLKMYSVYVPQYRKEYEVYAETFSHYWPIYQVEVRIQDDYINFINNLTLKKGHGEDWAPQAAALVASYKCFSHYTESPVFQYHFSLFKIYAATLRHNWQAGLKAATEALNYFHAEKYTSNDYLVALGNQKAGCQLMLRQFEAGKQELDNLSKLIQEGSPNWFKNREIATANEMNAGRYAAAWGMVQEIFSHPRFAKIPGIDQETWRLYDGYLQVMFDNHVFESPLSRKKSKEPFKYQRWANDMPLYSMDKQGGNIPLLLLQIHVLTGKLKTDPLAFDDICSRLESLRKYTSRNLDKENAHYRTSCFLSILFLLPRYILDYKQLEKEAAPLLQKMSQQSKGLSDGNFETEVVPYEVQWEWIFAQIAGYSRKSVSRLANPDTPAVPQKMPA